MPNRFSWKLWAAVGAASWLGGCVVTDPETGVRIVAGSSSLLDVSGEGEGEGNSTGTNFSTNDVAYLSQLGLMRGHLKVGAVLYANDYPDLASTHMKHPEMELYSSLVDAFRTRECDGFARELEELSSAVVGRVTKEIVATLHDSVVNKIRECESTVQSSPQKTVAVIESLLRTAGEEYAIGVVEGQIANLHEFQDAWGFTQIAHAMSRNSVFAGSDRSVAVAAQIQLVIDDLNSLWPDISSERQILNTAAAQLYGAAARIEIIALSLEE